MNPCMDAAATAAWWEGLANVVFLVCMAVVVIVFLVRFFR